MKDEETNQDNSGRIFKFRVWHIDEMHYLDKGASKNLCFFSEGIPWGLYDSATEARLVTGDPNAILNTPGILMQFTGLKDKNGKEIYEGDIVRCEPSYVLGVVEWCEPLALFQLSVFIGGLEQDATMTIYSHQEGLKNMKREVVGNVFENENLLTPDLIKLK